MASMKQPRGSKARKEERMYSMWDAPSDRDYYDQFNPEPPEDEEPEPDDSFNAEEDGINTGEAAPPAERPSSSSSPNDLPEVA